METLHDSLNYWTFIVLMMIGLYAMISKRNLIKKLIGMSIFQAAIILFFVSIGVKENAKIPIVIHDAAHHAAHEEEAGSHHPVEEPEEKDADQYANPLPHVLMLTAIVVGVATLGVGLAIVQKIYAIYGTLEEDEIMNQIKDD